MIECDSHDCPNPARHFYKINNPAFDTLVGGKWKPGPHFYVRCTLHRMQGVAMPYGDITIYWDENSSEEEYVIYEIMES